MVLLIYVVTLSFPSVLFQERLLTNMLFARLSLLCLHDSEVLIAQCIMAKTLCLSFLPNASEADDGKQSGSKTTCDTI